MQFAFLQPFLLGAEFVYEYDNLLFLEQRLQGTLNKASEAKNIFFRSSRENIFRIFFRNYLNKVLKLFGKEIEINNQKRQHQQQPQQTQTMMTAPATSTTTTSTTAVTTTKTLSEAPKSSNGNNKSNDEENQRLLNVNNVNDDVTVLSYQTTCTEL